MYLKVSELFCLKSKNWNFQRWSPAAILIFKKTTRETIRIRISATLLSTTLKILAFYIFLHFAHEILLMHLDYLLQDGDLDTWHCNTEIVPK